MALSQAPLGQLPYMNLARYVPDRIDEPAWHKALSAFLVSAAVGAGRDITSNAMTPDQTQQAVRMGLIKPGQVPPPQGFMDKLEHGPRYTMADIQQMTKDRQFQDNQDRLYSREFGTGGLKEQELAEQHRHNIADETGKQYAVDEENKRAINKEDDSATDNFMKLGNNIANASQKDRLIEGQLGNYKSEAEERAARTSAEAQKAADQHAQQLGVQKILNDASAGPNNNSSQNTDTTVSPTVPGSSPASMSGHYNIPDFQALTQAPSGSSSQFSSNPMAGIAAGAPGQWGQSQAPGTSDTSLVPAGNPASGNLIQNVLQQYLGQSQGQPSTGMVPGHPLGMSGAATGSSGYFPPPVSNDPRVAAMVYNLARLKGQPQGLGGTPGVGGLPLGYG